MIFISSSRRLSVSHHSGYLIRSVLLARHSSAYLEAPSIIISASVCLMASRKFFCAFCFHFLSGYTFQNFSNAPLSLSFTLSFTLGLFSSTPVVIFSGTTGFCELCQSFCGLHQPHQSMNFLLFASSCGWMREKMLLMMRLLFWTTFHVIQYSIIISYISSFSSLSRNLAAVWKLL